MRSVDVFKCWPFASTVSRDASREELQSWLPPMTLCPRSDACNDHAQNPPSPKEVSRTDDEGDEDCSEEESEESAPASDAAVSNNEDEKLEMVCPVCREFNAATLTAVNAHIDGCLAQTMREERRHMRIMNLKSSSSSSPISKSKAPKKRSIAEIFKVEEQHQQQPPQPQQPPPQIESVLKFWPFREDEADEVSNTVSKFEWLSRRLEALRSTRGGGESSKSDRRDSAEVDEEEKLEMVCPVCRDFNAATVTAVNAHIDGCLAQAVREERRQMRRTVNCKPKPKALKKRSIAEILTVAPPIEAGKSKGIQVMENEEKSDYRGEDSACAAAASASTAAPVVSVIKNRKSTNKSRKKKKMKKAKKKKSKVEKYGESGVLFVNNEKKTVVSKKKKKKSNVFNNGPTGKKVC